MEVNCPGQRATVLVAFAWIGRTPTPSSAGNERKEPPPATALRAPARKEPITSQMCCQCAILLLDLQDEALEVFGLGYCKNHRVVWSGSTPFEQADAALRVAGGRSHYTMKFVPGNVMGAGAGNQRSTRTQHLQGAQVELLVPAQSALHGALGFCESRRVEDHGVIGVARCAPIAGKVKCVSLDPLHLSLNAIAIDLQVLFRHLERGAGGVNAGHPAAASSQMQRETALIGADVEGVATSIERCRGVVQTLVEKRSCFLACIGVVVKSQPVQVKDRRQLGNGFSRVERSLGWLAELLEFPDAGIGSLYDGGRLEL